MNVVHIFFLFSNLVFYFLCIISLFRVIRPLTRTTTKYLEFIRNTRIKEMARMEKIRLRS